MDILLYHSQLKIVTELMEFTIIIIIIFFSSISACL
jgi:hypothetical protein